jgi:adenylate kinase family enzyme
MEFRRISVVGTSGAGKSTLARAISERLGIPHVELDAIHHQPGWESLPVPEFRAAVEDVVAGDAWVVDGNYLNKLGDLVWLRADAVVWIDPPRARVMWQVVRRTLLRVLLRQELWNGNRERWSEVLTLDPQRSIVVWAWTTYRSNRERFATAQADPAYRDVRFVRLRTRREVAAFLRGLDATPR